MICIFACSSWEILGQAAASNLRMYTRLRLAKRWSVFQNKLVEQARDVPTAGQQGAFGEGGIIHFHGSKECLRVLIL